MSGGRSFYGSPTTGGRTDRRIAALVAVLLVGFLGVLIVKPWGVPTSPGPTPTASGPAGPLPVPSLRAPASEVPSAGPPAAFGPLPVAFTTPLPPASATWTGLRWRRLEPDDPLSLVTSVLRWSRGFIAVGWVAGRPLTPVWTSADGAHWDPLISGTSTTFWPGLAVLGFAELRTSLVAVTEALPYCGGPCSLKYIPPVVSWKSNDGRRWTPNLLLPPEWLASPTLAAPLFAAGEAGLVVATSGPSARLAVSPDGSHWKQVPEGGFPASFALNDLRGTASGYVAVGRWMTGDNRREAAALWSGDGRHWSEVPTILPTWSHTGTEDGSAVASLVVGRDGMVAVERGVTTPGATLWWQSSDGRRWRSLPTYAPLGPTTCTGEGCGRQPNGSLAGDGQRLLAIRGGPDARAWESSDGRSWRRLDMTGEIPSEDATHATLLPGGVLVTDGSTTWFGEALVH